MTFCTFCFSTSRPPFIINPLNLYIIYIFPISTRSIYYEKICPPHTSEWSLWKCCAFFRKSVIYFSLQALWTLPPIPPFEICNILYWHLKFWSVSVIHELMGNICNIDDDLWWFPVVYKNLFTLRFCYKYKSSPQWFTSKLSLFFCRPQELNSFSGELF